MAKDYKDIPDLLKHCTVAVYKKLNGPDEKRFVDAWTIARAHLTKYGYLAPGSEEGPLGNIKFTPKGAGKTKRHTQEGAAKSKFFDSKVHLLEQSDEPAEPTGGKPVDLSTGKTPQAFNKGTAKKPIGSHAKVKHSFYQKLKSKLTKHAQAKKVKASKARRAKRS